MALFCKNQRYEQKTRKSRQADSGLFVLTQGSGPHIRVWYKRAERKRPCRNSPWVKENPGNPSAIRKRRNPSAARNRRSPSAIRRCPGRRIRWWKKQGIVPLKKTPRKGRSSPLRNWCAKIKAREADTHKCRWTTLIFKKQGMSLRSPIGITKNIRLRRTFKKDLS